MHIIPRLKGSGKHCINYRHIIDWLIRKPGAFAEYKYKTDLFPNSYFRMAYDNLQEHHTGRTGDKEYLKILYISAYESEWKVEAIIKLLLFREEKITGERIKKRN